MLFEMAGDIEALSVPLERTEPNITRPPWVHLAQPEYKAFTVAHLGCGEVVGVVSGFAHKRDGHGVDGRLEQIQQVRLQSGIDIVRNGVINDDPLKTMAHGSVGWLRWLI